MRFAGKLLLSYLVMIVLVGVLLGGILPQVVVKAVVNENQNWLEQQATSLATRIDRYQLDTDLGKKETLKVLVSSTQLLLSRQLFVVDANGIVVATAEKNAQWKDKPFPRPKLIAKTLAEGKPDHSNDPIHPFSRGTPAMDNYVWATEPIKDHQGNILGAVVAIRPVQEVNEASRAVISALLLWIGAALLIGLAASYIISRGLVWRLRRMGQAARTMAEGDLSVRVKATGGDEVAELGEHFNHMAERNEALVAGLKRSEALRRELVASVSHELRTPMTSIQGFAEALRDGVVKDPEQQSRYLNVIAEESTRLARLIDDLFEVSKLEAGQGEFRFTTLPMAGWLERFVARTRPRLEQEGLRLLVTVPPGAQSAQVLADPGRLDQVLTNLVNNAARFAPTGTPVEIRIDPATDGVTVSVHNQGDPIPKEQQERLFQRFFQGRQGRPHKGAGLGLSIVKSIVEAHGGQVGVRSAAEIGTTFWFTLRAGT